MKKFKIIGVKGLKEGLKKGFKKEKVSTEEKKGENNKIDGSKELPVKKHNKKLWMLKKGFDTERKLHRGVYVKIIRKKNKFTLRATFKK